MRQRARLSWPGMDNEIANAAGSSKKCMEQLPSQAKEPLRPHTPASRPFEQVHADIGTVNGRHFLIMVDQFSGWPHVVAFPNKYTTSRRIIDALRQFFSNVGVPVKLWSDNGSQFTAFEFRKFFENWGVCSGTSSPHYAQSNGKAESEIKVMKKIIKGCWSSGAFDEDKFSKAILLFRNTPRFGGASPAEIIFKRPVRDALPAHRKSFAAEWQRAANILEERTKRAKNLQAEHFNRTTHELPALDVGSHVLIQNPVKKAWNTSGVVVEIGTNRDYLVKTAAG